MFGFCRGLCLLMLMVISAVTAGAVMYECTRPDGTIIFTDDPLRASGNCVTKPVESHNPAQLAPPSAQAQPLMPAGADAVVSPAENRAVPTLETFQSEAEQLVMKYKDARRRYNHASFVKDQLAAKRELAEIKSQKITLLAALQQSSLGTAEKQQIMATLDAIAD